MSEPLPTAPQSYLNLIEACDNFHPARSPEKLITWRLTPEPSSPAIGLLRPPIVKQLLQENEEVSEGKRPWHLSLDGDKQMVSFASWVDTPAKRTAAMKEMLERWRDTGLWPGVIGPKKWRGEMYPVYRFPFGKNDAPVDEAADDSLNYAFRMERAACALFGVVTYGVHMNIYVDDPQHGCRVWVPKRAKTKQTWPGYFDNSVAGGIPAGLGPFESLVKESMEEASIAEEVVRKHATAVGGISYFFRHGHFHFWPAPADPSALSLVRLRAGCNRKSSELCRLARDEILDGVPAKVPLRPAYSHGRRPCSLPAQASGW